MYKCFHCFFLFIFVLCLSSQAEVYQRYENQDQPMATTRMTQDKNRSEYMSRKRAYTQNGHRVFHCVRDSICYRVDPEGMLIYKNHFVRANAKEKSNTWYARQPRYMRTRSNILATYTPRTKAQGKIVVKQKDLVFKTNRFQKNRYPGTYYSKINPSKP